MSYERRKLLPGHFT